MRAQPPAVLWASVFVDELVRCGVQKAVIAPGSRSTPLVLAMANHPGLETYSLLDERSAAYFALGIGLASGVPAALVCTSGTAGANFFPAVIEAAQSFVPMLVLTADRPHELRGSGANQTIDQIRLYGDYPRSFQDMPLPEPDPDPKTLRFLRTSADRAFAACTGLPAGPVHINFPFRKPFEPEPGTPYPFEAGILEQSGEGPLAVVKTAGHHGTPSVPSLPSRTLLVAGPGCPGGEFPAALAAFSAKSGYPILADGLSGLRFGPWVSQAKVLNPQACRGAAAPQLVLQFGQVPTSRVLADYFEHLPPETRRVSIMGTGSWHDDAHSLREVVSADPAAYCRMLETCVTENSVDPAWAEELAAADAAYQQSIVDTAAEGWFEGLYVRELFEVLPDDSLVFVANSNPVRHLEEWVPTGARRIRVFANRGASGIDGNLSTAFGIACVQGRPITVVCGDLAFYHDLNALLALGRFGIRAVVVLVHNNGGGIFHRLPIAGYEPAFTELFLTPHHMHFEGAAQLFDLDFERISKPEAFREQYLAALENRKATILECVSDAALHERSRKKIVARFEHWLKKGDENHE